MAGPGADYGESTRDGKFSARRALDCAERALVGPERAARRHGVEDGEALGLAALREHVLDPRPARARRPHVDPPAQAAAQAVEAVLDDPDARERRRVERRVALGAEGRDPERERDDARDLGGEGDALVDVGVGLARACRSSSRA